MSQPMRLHPGPSIVETLREAWAMLAAFFGALLPPRSQGAETVDIDWEDGEGGSR